MTIPHLKRVVMTACATAMMVTWGNPAATQGYPVSTYSVELNKTEFVTLPGKAGSIVVGNPNIADVSVHSDQSIFVIGRSFGETNIIVLDPAGGVVMNANVQVVNTPTAHAVRVYSGGATRRSYSCTPYCLPSPVLGDDPGFVKANTSTTAPISNPLASSGTAPAQSSRQYSGVLNEPQPQSQPLPPQLRPTPN